MRYVPAVMLFFAALLTGCASLRVPSGGAYPFRASFDGSAFIQGQTIPLDGALSIPAEGRGFAQIYGPGGIAAFTLDITEDRARLYNLWGKQIDEYSFPGDQFIGLIAGIPPRSRYIWKRSADGGSSVTYSWGNLLIDEDALPRELHVRSTPPLDVSFAGKGRTITLMMTRGSDKVGITLTVIEGGRWNKPAGSGAEGGL
ncbi:MAG TPA: hypothetical protein PLF54_00675 [Deltaproteobacteria bacterium]|nr:hypothetical protein [Deltaproteobacteria bacterium]